MIIGGYRCASNGNCESCNYGLDPNGDGSYRICYMDSSGSSDAFTYNCTCESYNYYCPSGYEWGSCDGMACRQYDSCLTTENTCQFGYIW